MSGDVKSKMKLERKTRNLSCESVWVARDFKVLDAWKNSKQAGPEINYTFNRNYENSSRVYEF